ncbi:MAG TPA: hypothetical protein PKD78_02225 [Saprospiraceae bacterium]|nr:hypothetical protein [Saprospiraceae bacterium]
MARLLRPCLILLLTCGLALPSGALDSAPSAAATTPATGDPILLPEGTVITLELYEAVSSRNRRAGDLVQMGVYKAYMSGGVTLIKENAYAEGKVVLAHRRGVFGRPGRVVVSAVNVESVDNQRIALVGQYVDPPGDGRRMLAWAGSVILTLVGTIVLIAVGGPPALALPLLLFGLLVSGREVEIPARTKVQAVVKYDTMIQP